MKPKAPSYGVQDVRSPSERALDESRAEYFKGLMGQEDWGYKDESAAMDPVYERARQRMERSISQSAADRGFGTLRYGPGVEASARGSQEMEENRAAADIQRRQQYREWVASQGKSMPSGREVVQTSGGRPSAFSMLAGPVLGAIGTGMGGPIGGAIGGSIGGMMGGGGGFGGLRTNFIQKEPSYDNNPYVGGYLSRRG